MEAWRPETVRKPEPRSHPVADVSKPGAIYGTPAALAPGLRTGEHPPVQPVAHAFEGLTLRREAPTGPRSEGRAVTEACGGCDDTTGGEVQEGFLEEAARSEVVDDEEEPPGGVNRVEHSRQGSGVGADAETRTRTVCWKGRERRWWDERGGGEQLQPSPRRVT